MAVTITLNIRLGPLVSLRLTGDNCQELAEALEGYHHLNTRLDALCGDLAERIYPEGMEPHGEPGEEEAEEHGGKRRGEAQE